MEEYKYINVTHEIDSVISEISEIWEDLQQYDMTRIREIWNSPIAEDYISKFNDVDSIINQIINCLRELKCSWENYNALESSRGINDEQRN